MLLDKRMVTNIIRNSKDKEQMIQLLDDLPDARESMSDDIRVNYDLAIRGSQISNTDCRADVFIDAGGCLGISMYDDERCSGATFVTIERQYVKILRNLCDKALNIFGDNAPKQEEKDSVDAREEKVIDLLDSCLGVRFERKDMIPVHQAVLNFYSSRGKVKKLTGLQTTRFNAIINTLGYIQKSHYLDSVTGKRVYYIEKINE